MEATILTLVSLPTKPYEDIRKKGLPKSNLRIIRVSSLYLLKNTYGI